MVCFASVGFGVQLTFRALALRRSSLYSKPHRHKTFHYQPLMFKPKFSLLAFAEKTVFLSKLVILCLY